MKLKTATKQFNSIDLELDWEVITDERIADGFPADKLVRVHPNLGIKSVLTFNTQNNPIYQVEDI